MKERIKGVFTKKKIFHFLKMALFVVALSLILLSLLGTVAHATGLVDDTINAENLYSKYPLSNYQLDFYVDNSWSWLPWNWLDGIGKSVQYGLYCITNFVWTISLYLSNATGYVVQEAYKLDFINDMADSIGKSIQTLAGVTQNGFSSSGFYVGFLLLIILVVGLYVACGIDFITKPYDTLILLEKIKRALQLSNPNNFRELVKKDCTLDLHLSILKYQEQSIELTRNEFRILYYFFMNEDKVISKEELLEKLWNDKYYIDENVLLVNMTRLKKKMKEIGIVHLLENIRGKGWKL